MMKLAMHLSSEKKTKKGGVKIRTRGSWDEGLQPEGRKSHLMSSNAAMCDKVARQSKEGEVKQYRDIFVDYLQEGRDKKDKQG